MVVRISEAISRVADNARLDQLPPPVIRASFETIHSLMTALAQDINCNRSDLRGEGFFGLFDGVRFVVSPEPLDAWRDHFGALADIWQDTTNV